MLSIISCNEIREPEETMTTPNDYKVSKLFTIDGITVYRFYDRGRSRYFTSQNQMIHE